MQPSSAHSILLPLFTRASTVPPGAPNSRHITLSSLSYFNLEYGVDDFERLENSISHFPVVLHASGHPWREACYYIYKRLAVDGAAIATVQAIARDLSLYLRFIEEEGIKFDCFPALDALKPTYRYKRYLMRLVLAQKIKSTTASRRMSSVIGFYKRLVEDEILSASLSLWKTKQKWFRSGEKKHYTEQVDVAIIRKNGRDPRAIYDDGLLCPLTANEQLTLFEGLRELDNIEMILIFSIAVFVGARIQTILTLRVDQFSTIKKGKDHRVVAGKGTGIDTKNSKRMILYFPDWLAEKIKIYIDSPRAQDRRGRCVLSIWNHVPYVFLSNRATPYQDSIQDPLSYPISGPREGQAVRQFLYDRVLPLIDSLGGNFQFKFHDLRATYGMNLTEKLLGLVEEGKLTLSQARSMLKETMGHESYETTDRYLNAARLRDIASIAQDEFEDHIVSCAKRVIKDHGI